VGEGETARLVSRAVRVVSQRDVLKGTVNLPEMPVD
jgi:hypothetical protein